MADVHVTIAYVHQNDVGAAFVESMLRMLTYDRTVGSGYLGHESGFDMSGAFLPIWGRGGSMDMFRNVGAETFLNSDSDWLLWVDSDMGFPADAVERLMARAHPTERPIIGGLCFIEQTFSNDFTGGLIANLAPTIYDWIFMPNGDGYKLLPRLDYARNSLVECAATGTGFLLTHRSVFERISDWCVKQGAPPNIWYQRIPGPTGQPSGEDISFCLRAGQLGIPVHVDTSVHITHQKTVWWREKDYDQHRVVMAETGLPLLPRDQWPQLLINRHADSDARRNSPLGRRQFPPATDSTLILVPVMRRPQNALSFMKSFLETTDTKVARVVAMCDRHDFDAARAWQAQGAVVDARSYRRQPGGSFAQKVNAGFAEYGADYEWVFIVGDDVIFHEGWLDATQHVGHTTGRAVIGTNDLGSERVKAGNHATHLLIRSDYIAQNSASWDLPGVIAHEGYGHWYVDDEIVSAAKERGQWAPCLDAVVEHRHPAFGTGREDDVYRLGQSTANADAELFRARNANHPTLTLEN